MRILDQRNERGIALLIVLLVTALLIALIFEFSYATRISLNNAINFRDSQRAYFLAQAGVNAFKTSGAKIRELIPHGDLRPLPMIGEADTVIMVKWEDQRALINVNTVPDDKRNIVPDAPTAWLANLFSNKGISTEVVDKIIELKKLAPEKKFIFVSELHAVMSDEDYRKVAPFLTADSDSLININTASEDVLNSVLPNNQTEVNTILNRRKTNKISPGEVGLTQDTVKNVNVYNSLKDDSTYFRVYAYATVGGYTKQVEAAMNGNTISYWRAL